MRLPMLPLMIWMLCCAPGAWPKLPGFWMLIYSIPRKIKSGIASNVLMHFGFPWRSIGPRRFFVARSYKKSYESSVAKIKFFLVETYDAQITLLLFDNEADGVRSKVILISLSGSLWTKLHLTFSHFPWAKKVHGLLEGPPWGCSEGSLYSSGTGVC